MATRLVDGLNRLLADGTVLYQKLRQYHWNVEGPQFFELHAKFEELYTRWNISLDEIAERILMIEGVPLRTLASVLQAATLQEDEETPPARDMVERLHADLQLLNASMSELITLAEQHDDRGTANLLDGLRDAVEKDLWMLRATLKETAAKWG